MILGQVIRQSNSISKNRVLPRRFLRHKNLNFSCFNIQNYCDSIYGGSIFDMTQYGESLYVSICTGKPENAVNENTMQSFGIVRGDVAKDGSWKWTSVVGDKEKDGAKYTFGIDPDDSQITAPFVLIQLTMSLSLYTHIPRIPTDTPF